jgi:hypothetical protein
MQIKQISMVAGGTGITPMYQLARAICKVCDLRVCVHIRVFDSCLLRRHRIPVIAHRCRCCTPIVARRTFCCATSWMNWPATIPNSKCGTLVSAPISLVAACVLCAVGSKPLSVHPVDQRPDQGAWRYSVGHVVEVHELLFMATCACRAGGLSDTLARWLSGSTC